MRTGPFATLPFVGDEAIELYIRAFHARCDVAASAGQEQLDEPGVRGVLAWTGGPRARLLVTDDRAYDVLAALLADIRAGMINVFASASQCADLVGRHTAWRAATVTAMIRWGLDAVPSSPLPDELTLRRVRRLEDDPRDGVSLADAAAAAMNADPRIEGPPEAFDSYLRGLSPTVRLFAAVDRDGLVRATSGTGVFGHAASVFFVNTDPGWRKRGVAHAMTAAALVASKGAGAQHACLDATDTGLRIYEQLGFQPVTPTTHFFRAG
jgi:GNAT superfamily N-acetyltransferase